MLLMIICGRVEPETEILMGILGWSGRDELRGAA